MDRKKTMMGLKKVDTPVLSGYQTYHNYMLPHEGSDGKTTAETSEIRTEWNNKWLTLIQNAKGVIRNQRKPIV